jgi:hypothetical protein
LDEKTTTTLFLITTYSKAQISVYSDSNYGVEITPKGVKHSLSSATHKSNIAIGSSTLNNCSTGQNNTAIGHDVLFINVTGSSNVGVGNGALNGNNGNANTAIGSNSLYMGYNFEKNTAIGTGALYSANGSLNTAVGNSAMAYSFTGKENVAVGMESMLNNMHGSYNVALGRSALFNSANDYNTAVGFKAGYTDKGSYNTFVGHNADSNGDFVNTTAIGYSAIVDASNKVRIGNSAITVIEGQVPWSNPSDRRLKENIHYTNRLGLDFITRLQTVSYNYIADGNKTRYDGFIAQDIEKVMKDLNIPFSGLKKSDTGTYSLAYSDFVMPLINAVKEQQVQIEELKKQNQLLSARLSEIDEIKAELMKLKSSVSNRVGSK